MTDHAPTVDAPTREMSLRDYARIVRRRAWIVAIAVVAAALGALALSAMQERTYEANAQMLVNPRSNGAVFDQSGTTNVSTLERAIKTEIRVIEGHQVRARVQENLGLATLPPAVEAASIDDTDVVSLTVRSADPEVARQVADAYVVAYVDIRRDQALESLDSAQTELRSKIDEIEAQIVAIDDRIAATPEAERPGVASSLAGQRQALINQQSVFDERLDQMQVDAALTASGASVVQPAEVPTSAIAPQPEQALLLACAVGLLLGLGAAFLLDYVDDSVRTEDDVARLTVRPVLAAVPMKPAPDDRPIAVSAPRSFAVEAYRSLRTNITFLGLDEPLRAIQVTSSMPGEGKTTTAANLAVVLAQAGQRVVLVDADLRRPRVDVVFGLPRSPGLTDVLLGHPLEHVVQVAAGVDIVTAGAVPPNPSELLSSDRVGLFLADLVTRYDHVIVDSAPLLPVSDSIALSRSVDGVLVVAQPRRTSRRSLADALGRLDRVGASVAGIVLNGTKGEGRRDPYGYSYGDDVDHAAEDGPAAHPAAAAAAPDLAAEVAVGGERR